MKYLLTITLGLFLFLGIPSVCYSQVIKSKETIKQNVNLKIKKKTNIKKEAKIMIDRQIMLKRAINLIFPTNNVTNVALNATLSWEAEITTNSDAVLFDVYFGTKVEPITKVSSGQTDKSYTPTLAYNTTYYWKVVKTGSNEVTDESSIQSFKTNLGIVWSDDTHGTYTDSRDNNLYNVIKIGEQVWFAENLAFLPEVSSTGHSNKNPVYYVYGYEGSDIEGAKSTYNYKTYGVLYNWFAAINGTVSSLTSNKNPSGIQGACPCGWHVPSYEEWGQLRGSIWNNGEIDSDIIGKSLAAKQYWDVTGAQLNDVGFGSTNNSSGFTALPGGRGERYVYDYQSKFEFEGIGLLAYFWTTTRDIWTPSVSKRASTVLRSTEGFVANFTEPPRQAQSVRCVKD